MPRVTCHMCDGQGTVYDEASKTYQICTQCGGDGHYFIPLPPRRKTETEEEGDE
jgi:DnaJ-class molecular chaperone